MAEAHHHGASLHDKRRRRIVSSRELLRLSAKPKVQRFLPFTPSTDFGLLTADSLRYSYVVLLAHPSTGVKGLNHPALHLFPAKWPCQLHHTARNGVYFISDQWQCRIFCSHKNQGIALTMASEQQHENRTVIVTGSSRGMYVLCILCRALGDKLTAQSEGKPLQFA